jgi:RES domain
MHPLGPLAEAVRRLPDGLDPRELRRPAWALGVPAGAVQAIGFDEAREWGLEPYDLVCPPVGYGACQAVGERLLAADEPPMLRVPSAALPGTWNLVVFGQRVVAPYDGEPADPTLDVPAAPTAARAQVLEELVPLVRPLDQLPHAAYDAWAAGRRFEFVQLATLSLGG